MDRLPPQLSAAIASAAAALRQDGATEVYVFGSHANGRATEASDLDLAVRGLPPERFFAAMGRAAMAAGKTIDLIDLDEGRPFGELLRTSGALRRVA